jgi:hypothetical protein
VFLFSFTGNFAVLEFIQSTFQLSFDYPRASKCVLQLVHLFLGRTGLNCASSKNDITDGVDTRIGVMSVDELTMVGPQLLDKKFGYFATC